MTPAMRSPSKRKSRCCSKRESDGPPEPDPLVPSRPGMIRTLQLRLAVSALLAVASAGVASDALGAPDGGMSDAGAPGAASPVSPADGGPIDAAPAAGEGAGPE